jgi:hypothetical protein
MYSLKKSDIFVSPNPFPKKEDIENRELPHKWVGPNKWMPHKWVGPKGETRLWKMLFHYWNE